jgi:hypothetical protein
MLHRSGLFFKAHGKHRPLKRVQVRADCINIHAHASAGT